MKKRTVEIFPCNLWMKGKKGQSCSLIIPEGHDLCYFCEGIGGHAINITFKQRTIDLRLCPVCSGKGYVDFVTFAMRKPKYELYKKNSQGRYMSRPQHKDVSFKCTRKCKRIKRWAREQMSKNQKEK
jgi:hypothetical protein